MQQTKREDKTYIKQIKTAKQKQTHANKIKQTKHKPSKQKQKKANKHANKNTQTNKQTNKHTNTNKQTNTQTRTHKQTNTQTDKAHNQTSADNNTKKDISTVWLHQSLAAYPSFDDMGVRGQGPRPAKSNEQGGTRC